MIALQYASGYSLRPMHSPRRVNAKIYALSEMTSRFSEVLNSGFILADTSVSEEEVLAVAGQAADLPSPLYALGFAAIIFLGTAVLQFSLGDLTKEEGQARVRDFLQTRRDTERKRGYFD